MGQELFWKATGCCWEPDGLGTTEDMFSFWEAVCNGHRAWWTGLGLSIVLLLFSAT